MPVTSRLSAEPQHQAFELSPMQVCVTSQRRACPAGGGGVLEGVEGEEVPSGACVQGADVERLWLTSSTRGLGGSRMCGPLCAIGTGTPEAEAPGLTGAQPFHVKSPHRKHQEPRQAFTPRLLSLSLPSSFLKVSTSCRPPYRQDGALANCGSVTLFLGHHTGLQLRAVSGCSLATAAWQDLGPARREPLPASPRILHSLARPFPTALAPGPHAHTHA